MFFSKVPRSTGNRENDARIDLRTLEYPRNYYRIGRTGRMERKALAVSLCVRSQEIQVLQDVQDTYGVSLVELPQHLDPELYLDYTN